MNRKTFSRWGVVVALVAAAFTSAQAQFVYGTSFESFQGFTANQTLDQQGFDGLGVWTATPPENAYVVDEAARSGTQSVRLYPAETGQTDANKIISIRNLTQPIVNGQVSMMVGSNWFPTSTQSAAAFTNFQFVKGSTPVQIMMGMEQLAGGPAKIKLRYMTTQPVDLSIVAPLTLNANQWYDLRFAWTWGSSQVDFFVNNNLIGGINNFICNCPLRSDQISLFHSRSSNAGAQGAYYDDLQLAAAVPEPGTLAALGLGMAWFARRRRKA